MNKIKRIVSAAGAILLLAMYGSTLFFACTDSTRTMGWLKASLVCTVVIPVLLYAYTLVYRNIHGSSSAPEDDKEDHT